MLLKKTIYIFLFLILAVPGYAQWVNSPSSNTRLVIDVFDPKNIQTIDDKKGGTFIFWEDNKNKIQNDIYFQHIDENGLVSFRADGKRISDMTGNKSFPVAAPTINGNAVVLWKDFTNSKKGDLLIQKVTNNGDLLWKDGIKINKSLFDIKDYSIATDRLSNIYISYIGKDDTDENQLIIQKYSSTGTPLFGDKTGITVNSNKISKSATTIFPDENGGLFVFWTEYSSNKNILLAQRVDSSGNSLWSKKPVQVSSNVQDVFTYSAKKNSSNNIYVCWQVQQKDKDIFHQYFNESGKPLWGTGGRLITAQKGNQLNPQAVLSDTSIFISWTNDINNHRNIYVQKFNIKGNSSFKEIPVLNIKGDQFGQKIINDNNDGIIIGWIDKRADTLRPNVYAQRISPEGKMIWDSSGIQIATHPNTDKSYISIISDNIGGAIFTFKEKRQNKNEIFGQKVFNTGTYLSQIKGFKLQNTGDSILLTWEAYNESDKTVYNIERLDNEQNKWIVVGSLKSNGGSNSKSYTYYDTPKEGSNYYRIVQKGSRNNVNLSDIVNINFFEHSSNIVVGQNDPNPFKNTTKISFYLPSSARVKIEFFDSHIEKITEVDEIFPAGQSDYIFKVDNLKPGIYFFRFQSGKFVEVKKMVVSNE